MKQTFTKRHRLLLAILLHGRLETQLPLSLSLRETTPNFYKLLLARPTYQCLPSWAQESSLHPLDTTLWVSFLGLVLGSHRHSHRHALLSSWAAQPGENMRWSFLYSVLLVCFECCVLQGYVQPFMSIKYHLCGLSPTHPVHSSFQYSMYYMK